MKTKTLALDLSEGALARRAVLGAAHGAIGWARRNGLFFALLALFVYFSLASEHFLTWNNLRVILLNVAIIGLVAVPGAMLVLSGYVDLSVGSMAVFTAIVFGQLFEAGVPGGLCFLVALLCGVAWGLVQGVLVAQLGLSPIVVSLGGLAGLRGLALFISGAFVYQGFSPWITELGNGEAAGLPIPVWIFFGAFIVGGYVWFLGPWGRHMTAIGADKAAAHAVGIKTRRVPLALYVASGAAAALGGILLMGQLDATSLSIGQGMELDVLTAILLGGISFTGGRGSLFGVLMGVLFIGVIQNGLLLVNVSSYLYQVCVGAALVFAAALDVVYQRLDRIVIRELVEAPTQAAVSGAAPLETAVDLAGREAAPASGEVGAARVPILEVKNLTKSFGAVRAVRAVSFDLQPGEVVAIVGDNGAGKTTLVNMLAGVMAPDEGDLVLGGVAHAFDNPSDARAAGIETVFQNLALVPTLDIAENVFLKRELVGRGIARLLRVMSKARMRRGTVEGFERLGLVLPAPTTKVAALSGGQRQAVAIARAVLWGSRIVILDEPAAALGVRQTEIVLRFVEQLKEHGVAVVFISHNMEHVLRVADRVIVLRLGEKVFDGPRADVDGEDLIALITGARLAAFRGETATTLEPLERS